MLRNSKIALLLIFLNTPVVAQKTKTLSPTKINKLVPAKLKGYHQKGDAKSTSIQLGNLTYSLSERSFEKGRQSIKILLFDYVEAPIMYDQAIRKWSTMTPVESDSIIFRRLHSSDSTAWELHSIISQHSQIIMGINKRFFLMLDAESMSLYELRQILMNFEFEKFPKPE
jgi:hypothetical protein